MSRKNSAQIEIELGVEIVVPTQPEQTLQGPGQARSQKSAGTPANPSPPDLPDPMLSDSEDDDPIQKAEEARLIKAGEPPSEADAEPAEKPLPSNTKAESVIDSIVEFHMVWLLSQHVISQLSQNKKKIGRPKRQKNVSYFE
jgi:hypothetical protein